MSIENFGALRELILKREEIPVDLRMEYTTVFNTLSGNYPINNRIRGEIEGVPIILILRYRSVPNISGHFPVNTRVEGTIGDTPILATMKHQVVFSTLSGNIPVNTEAIVTHEGQKYTLDLPISRQIGANRGKKGGPKNKYAAVQMKFVAGQQVEVGGSGGSGIAGEAGIPFPAGLKGVLGDIEIDLTFRQTYFCNTSSGRTPVPNRAIGFLRKVA